MEPSDSSQEKEQRLIRYLLKKALLTEVELQICLKFQKKLAQSGRTVSLAKIILKKNYLSRSALQDILYQLKTASATILETKSFSTSALASKKAPSKTPSKALSKTPSKALSKTPSSSISSSPQKTTRLKKKSISVVSSTERTSLEATKLQKTANLKTASKSKEASSNFAKKTERVEKAKTTLQTSHSISQKIPRRTDKTSIIRRRTEKRLQAHLQEPQLPPREKKETMQLKKAALFLFFFCVLLTILVVIGVLNKQRLKKQKELILKQQIQLELTQNSSNFLEEEKALKNTEGTPEIRLKKIETQLQEKKYWASWEELRQMLKRPIDLLSEKKTKTLLAQTELLLLQQFLFGSHLQFTSEGQIQLIYDFSQQDYLKDFIQKNCFYQPQNHYQIREGSLYHIGRCHQFLQIKLNFQLKASQGKLSLYGLNYRLHYPVSGKGISLQIKGQKKPLWRGNGPKLHSGELFLSLEPSQIKLVYQNQTILELFTKNIQSGGVVIQFQNEKGEEGFLLEKIWINSKFDDEWTQKILQDLAKENAPK